MARQPEEQRPSQPGDKEAAPPVEDVQADWGPLASGIRGEVPGCPTGLSRPVGTPKKEPAIERVVPPRKEDKS